MKIMNNHTVVSLILMIVATIYSCAEKEVKKVPPLEIEVINVIQKDVPIYREFVGQVYGLLDIPIRARVEGFLVNVNFDEGFRVKKGQLLYTIDSQPFQAEVASMQSKVAEAHTYLVNASNELERYKPLAEINAVSQSDFDAAKAQKEAAEATLQAAKANLELANIKLSYTRISSPINGFIGKTEARIGEFVGREPNPVILNTVSKIEQVRIQFFVTEREFLMLAREIRDRMKDQVGIVENPKSKEERQNIELLLADGSIYDHRGKVDFINRNVDAATGSMMVQSSFPNPDGLLRPGMYAKLKIELDVAKGAILVPQRCVTELQGQYSVFVVDDANTIKTKQVKATAKINDLWLIEEGLKPGEKVVIEGLQKIASGAIISPKLVEFKSRINP